MDDILELLGTIPYDQRSGDGQTSKELRKMIQERAITRQQNSLRFQRDSEMKNRQMAVPQEMQQILMQAEGGEQQGPEQAQAPGADVGALFGE